MRLADTVRPAITFRLDLAQAINIATSIFIYCDGHSATMSAPIGRLVNSENLVSWAAGSKLAGWSVDDYSFIEADLTHQYLIAYRLLSDEPTVERQAFIEITTEEEG
jgi:hypothetical protein